MKNTPVKFTAAVAPSVVQIFINAKKDLIEAALLILHDLANDADLVAAIGINNGYPAHAVKMALNRDDVERVTINHGSKWVLDGKAPTVNLTTLVFMSRKSRWHTFEIPFDVLTDKASRDAWTWKQIEEAKKARATQARHLKDELRTLKNKVAKLPKDLREA